jgi:hypothetical protein
MYVLSSVQIKLFNIPTITNHRESQHINIFISHTDWLRKTLKNIIVKINYLDDIHQTTTYIIGT